MTSSCACDARACSFREPTSQIGAEPSLCNGDVDNNNEAGEFKPKTEPESPSHHQQLGGQPARQCGRAVNGGSGTGPSGSSSSVAGSEVGELRRMTSSHLLASRQPALPPYYQHQQMSTRAHHVESPDGYGISASSCPMGFQSLDAAAAVGFAQCAGRSFTATPPFNFSPVPHRISAASYYDVVRQAGFDGM